MNHPRIEVYRSSNDRPRDDAPPQPQWRWRLIAGNGEIVATGEAHNTAADAERASKTVCALAAGFPAVKVLE